MKSIIGYLPKEQQKDASDEIFKLEQRAKTNDPKVKAEVASYFKKNWFMGQAYEHANLKHEFSESDLKVNDFQKIAAEKQAELKNKKEEIEYQAWVDSGKPVDAEGNPVIYAKETRDNVTPSTYTIKDKAGKTTTVNMHPDLATYYEVVAAAKSGKPSDLFRWNGPSASEGGKGRVDLGRYHWLSGLEKGSVQGEWVQVKDAGFIKSIMDKVSTTVTGGGTSTTTTANLAYYNGMPAVFVNGAGKVIYGVKAGDGKPGAGFAGEDMSFIEVPDAKDYISNLRRNSKENDKKLIDASIPYGNIFEKGTVQQGTSSQSQVNLPKLQSGYIYVQRLNEDPYALRIDSLSSFLKKYPDTKVITTTK